ncbi:PLP-dependent aminotransferase family protein [Arhodomonas sp. SL1]|uniref:aminotransferase-like domain-containing protein n=1 Tax=Arhodomonas sp. SL1 TaxID=3425691 RepID=UPI003F883F00
MMENGSRADRIAARIRASIDAGQLPAGSRLASVRAAAREYGVSKNTVVEAYDRLVATGHIEARRGSGFYVARPVRHPASAPPPHFTEAIDLVSLLREQLNQHYEVRAGDGRPPVSWMETSELGRYLRRGNRQGVEADDFEYGHPRGYPPLRETIARTLTERAINAGAEQVLLTFGANHALDLLVRHFVTPGETVLVETPGYYPLFGKLRLHRAAMAGVPRGHDGPDPAALEAAIQRHRPRLMFVQPLAHNPTGTSMSLAAMHRLLRIAERHDLILIEDDPFADLIPHVTPRLAALDGLQRVIYLGTFSKTLSAGLRSGYIAAGEGLIDSLTDIKMLTVVTSSGAVERMIHDMILRGRYRRHLARLRERVARAGAEAITALEGIGIHGIEPPAGGYYLWCPLPEGMDDVALARRASAEGIFLAPGTLFRQPDGPGPPALRINICYATDARLLDFLRREITPRLSAGGSAPG